MLTDRHFTWALVYPAVLGCVWSPNSKNKRELLESAEQNRKGHLALCSGPARPNHSSGPLDALGEPARRTTVFEAKDSMGLLESAERILQIKEARSSYYAV